MTAEPQLAIGVAVPADHQAARELIEAELARADEEARAREFIDRLEQEQTLEFAI